MSSFKDIGRMVLEVQISDSLTDHAQEFDVPALVNAYVERFGFVDIDEVDSGEYWDLALKYDSSRTNGTE